MKLQQILLGLWSQNCTKTYTKKEFPLSSVKSTPCGAGLHQGGSIGTLLEQLLESAQNLNVMKVPQLIDEGMDKEGWSSVLEELKKLKLNYCHNNEEMESSDDD